MLRLITNVLRILPVAVLGALISVFFFEYQNGSHDTITNINKFGFGLSFGAFAGFLIFNGLSSKSSIDKANYIFFVALRYTLAILILSHAIEQVHGSSFEYSHFVKDQKIVEFSSKQFFWLFHAYNPLYQQIFGWILITCSAGLLYRSTCLLASFILLPIFIHIFILNGMFDVGLKLDSIVINASILGILLFYKDRIFQFFGNYSVQAPVNFPIIPEFSKTYKSLAILKFTLFIGYLTLLNNDTYQRIDRWWNFESPVLHGVWQIDQINSTSDSIPKFEKFFFEKGRRGFATVENDTTSGFQYIIDTSYNQLEFWNFHVYRSLDFKGRYKIISDDVIEYKGTNMNRVDSVYILLSKIPDYDYIK